MKLVLAPVILFFASALAQNFTINTPSNVDECEPTLLTWQGGNAPFFLSVLPGASPNGPAIEDLGTFNSSSVTWLCNIASGTSIGFTLRDSTGTVAQTAPVTINAGSSSSCLSTSSVSAGPTVTPSSGSATTGGTSTDAATGTSASATPTTSKSAASANVAKLGAAGFVGAAVVAVFL